MVYTLNLEAHVMNIVVIAQRDDNYCYDLAWQMYEKYGAELFQDIFDKL